jgi:hypothetical protein
MLIICHHLFYIAETREECWVYRYSSTYTFSRLKHAISG